MAFASEAPPSGAGAAGWTSSLIFDPPFLT
jgi:hypothetical protein